MKIVIKNKSDIPIYEQIEEQIKAAVLSGSAVENEQLPSVRQLAKDLKISVITTTRAYSELAEQGYIVSAAGKGYFVAPRNNELMRERMLRTVEDSFETAVKNGRNAGLTDQELIDLLKIIMEGQDNG